MVRMSRSVTQTRCSSDARMLACSVLIVFDRVDVRPGRHIARMGTLADRVGAP
jgi:hypothetical protein